MTRACCIENCYFGKSKHVRDNKISMFRIPWSPTTQEKWMATAAGKIRKRRRSLKNLYFCEKHFLESDIERSFETIITGKIIEKFRRDVVKLKPTAVPSIFPMDSKVIIEADARNHHKQSEEMDLKPIPDAHINNQHEESEEEELLRPTLCLVKQEVGSDIDEEGIEEDDDEEGGGEGEEEKEEGEEEREEREEEKEGGDKEDATEEMQESFPTDFVSVKIEAEDEEESDEPMDDNEDESFSQDETSTEKFPGDEVLNCDNVSTSCPECGENFADESSLVVHRDSCASRKELAAAKKKYPCDECNTVVSNPYYLKKHKELVHLKIKRYECPICSKPFGSRSNLMEHQRRHKDDRPFVCEHCGKSFKGKYELRSHARHHGYKPFQCSHCDEGFMFHNELKLHQLKHTGERPHECAQCGETFTLRKKLLLHERRKHSDERPFSCDECSATFKEKFNLKSEPIAEPIEETSCPAHSQHAGVENLSQENQTDRDNTTRKTCIVFKNKGSIKAQKAINESFKTLNEVLNKNKKDEDEYDLYGKLLATKLRKCPESMRRRIMYQIDGLFLDNPSRAWTASSVSSAST